MNKLSEQIKAEYERVDTKLMELIGQASERRGLMMVDGNEAMGEYVDAQVDPLFEVMSEAETVYHGSIELGDLQAAMMSVEILKFCSDEFYDTFNRAVMEFK